MSQASSIRKNQDRIEKRIEIDDAGLLGQAALEKARGLSANLRRERVEQGEASQPEAGVVEIGLDVAAGKAAVGVLLGAQIRGVTVAQILRQARGALGEARAQVFEIGTHARIQFNQKGPVKRTQRHLIR